MYAYIEACAHACMYVYLARFACACACACACMCACACVSNTLPRLSLTLDCVYVCVCLPACVCTHVLTCVFPYATHRYVWCATHQYVLCAAWKTCNVWDDAPRSSHNVLPDFASEHRQHLQLQQHQHQHETWHSAAPASARGEGQEHTCLPESLSPIPGARFRSPKLRAFVNPSSLAARGWERGREGTAGGSVEEARAAAAAAIEAAEEAANATRQYLQQWHPATAATHLEALQLQQEELGGVTLAADLRAHHECGGAAQMGAREYAAIGMDQDNSRKAQTGWVMSPAGSIAWMGVCVCVCVCACGCVWVSVYVSWVRSHAHAHAYMCVRVRVCMCLCLCEERGRECARESVSV